MEILGFYWLSKINLMGNDKTCLTWVTHIFLAYLKIHIKFLKKIYYLERDQERKSSFHNHSSTSLRLREVGIAHIWHSLVNYF